MHTLSVHLDMYVLRVHTGACVCACVCTLQFFKMFLEKKTRENGQFIRVQKKIGYPCGFLIKHILMELLQTLPMHVYTVDGFASMCFNSMLCKPA